MINFKNTYLLNTVISKNRLIVIEERVTTEGVPFVIVHNLYLSKTEIYNNFIEALKALCETTCIDTPLSEPYLDDVEYFVCNSTSTEGGIKL